MPAVLRDQLVDLVAAVLRQRAGDDERLAFQPSRTGSGGRTAVDSICTPCERRSSIALQPKSECRKS